jgi:hypothetical protein
LPYDISLNFRYLLNIGRNIGQKTWQGKWNLLTQANKRFYYLRKEVPMYKFMQFFDFAKEIFDSQKSAKTASLIMGGILQSQSPRISDISNAMPGHEAGNYKKIQRFLKQENLQIALNRLFNEDAEFVIGDPTEIERPGANKTDYVGLLRDGVTKGFLVLTLATPLRGRASPFHFIVYSSTTIGSDVTSRNLEHQRAVQGVKKLIGDRTLIFDREFSYLGFLLNLNAEGINYVIRLNLGAHPPKMYYDAEKKQSLMLKISPGKGLKIYRQVYYMGLVPVNVIGVWEKGFSQPLWIITSLEPEQALVIYKKRTKIEVSFRDLKSLLHMDKVMHKSRAYLEKMLALVLITYAIALLVGEALRDVRYAGVDPEAVDLYTNPDLPKSSKWYSYSGMFILIKRCRRFDRCTLHQVIKSILSIFSTLVFGQNVRIFVPT